ncbi:MAG: hypothetical protein GF405_02435 [Candidatus Eisenbacteria bacterium]|nr:hypothetical protein [Candidatus Eisenbacteria bacterium]
MPRVAITVLTLLFLVVGTAAAGPATVRRADAPTAVSGTLDELLPYAGRPPVLGKKVLPYECLDGEALMRQRQSLTGCSAPPGWEPRPAGIGSRDCELVCSPCAFAENEENCYDGYVDNWNGGCNSTPAVFDTLFPYFGEIVVCGTSGTYEPGPRNGGRPSRDRDTDWYSIILSEPRNISFCCIAEFPLMIHVVDGSAGCGSPVILETATADSCEEACIDILIGPGEYWLWVGSSVFSGVPCDSDYIMTVNGYYQSSCDLPCPDGGILEEEPPCEPDYDDHTNGGCNSDPYVFHHLDPLDDTIHVCGESGVHPYQDVCYRDTDWYEIVLDEPREIEFCVEPSFEALYGVISGDCDGMYTFIDSDVIQGCGSGCSQYALDPGTYWLFVAPASWYPVDCGSEYWLSVDGYTTLVEDVSWGSIKSLYRSPPTDPVGGGSGN